jgi:hypothetical protein
MIFLAACIIVFVFVWSFCGAFKTALKNDLIVIKLKKQLNQVNLTLEQKLAHISEAKKDIIADGTMTEYQKIASIKLADQLIEKIMKEERSKLKS